MNSSSRTSWYLLIGCVALAPIATTATSMLLKTLPLTYDPFVLPKLAALGVLTAMSLAFWLASKPEGVRWHPAATALGVMTILATLSAAFSLDPAVSLFGKDAAFGLVAILSIVTVVFLVLQHVTTMKRVTELTQGFVAGAGIAALFTLYQAAIVKPAYLDSIGLGAVGYLYGRGGGIFGNPDFAGAFFVAPFLLSLTLLVQEVGNGRKALWGVTSAALGAALVVTQVRGAWVGAAVGAVVLAIALWRTGVIRGRALAIGGAIAAAGALVGVAIITPKLLLERVVGGTGSLDEFSSGRLSGWSDAIAVIGDRPILGTGPDAFSLGWYKHAVALADRLTGAPSYFEDPHNFFVSVAATLGVPAFIALVAFAVLAVKSGLQTLKRASEIPTRGTVFAGWVAGFVGVATTALFAVTTIPLAIVIFVTAAVLAAPSSRRVDLAPTPDLAVKVVASLLVVVCGIGALIPFIADFQLGQYARSRSEAPLLSARAIAPWSTAIQSEYIAYRRAAIDQLLAAPDQETLGAFIVVDDELFDLTKAHPHELQYALARIDLLGRAAGMLGGEVPDKSLTVTNMTIKDYPKLVDLKISKARALNNLDRYEEAIGVLEPLPRSIMRDTALVESLLLAKRTADAKQLVKQIQTEYEGSPLAEAFLAQPSIAPYTSK